LSLEINKYIASDFKPELDCNKIEKGSGKQIVEYITIDNMQIQGVVSIKRYN